MILMGIKEKTKLLASHLNFVDRLYQEAIEANFSHEYMSPLNSIINNSKQSKTMLQKILPSIQKEP